MSTTRNSYDPYQLINDVVELPQSQDRPAEVAPGNRGEAAAAAGKLLRSLGVQPAIDPIESYNRSMDKVWSDWDDHPGPGSSDQGQSESTDA